MTGIALADSRPMMRVSASVQIFVNERPFAVPAGTTVRDAVGVADARLMEVLSDGSAYVTDGVGRELDPDSQVVSGGIYRIVVSAKRSSRTVSDQ